MKITKKAAAYCSIPLLMASVTAFLNSGEVESRLTEEDIRLIVDEEGCRLNPYYCTAGKLTNGVGHTGSGVHNIKTEKDAAKYLVKDLQDGERCIQKYFNGLNAPKYVYGSLVSIAHNTGCPRLRKQSGSETGFSRLSKKGDWKSVCYEFPKWVKQPELKPRREREHNYCLRGI